MSELDRQALQRLLDYIGDERDDRRSRILAEAEADAAAVLRDARASARLLVQRAVASERRRQDKAQGQMRADVQMRLRKAWFRLIRRELDHAWPDLHKAVIAHWDSSPENRCNWLHLTLDIAAHSLGPGLWRVEHPDNWHMLEGGPVFRLFGQRHEGLQIHCEPQSQPAGFRVSCGNVSVSTTPDGLFARKSRIEGVWLAMLHREAVLTLPAAALDDG